MTDLPDFTIEELEELTRIDLGLFGNEEAVDLGLSAVEVITERELNLSVDVVVRDDLAFRARLGSTGPDNDPWLQGKAAVARHFEEPSLLVRRRLEASGQSVQDFGLNPDVYRAHGGSIPLRAGGLVIGTITVSGEPDVVDHEVAAEALRRFLDR
ncbi:heme-binding protein [Salinibacterium soli]|uniref:Heme-binding protein n=1 Tax=Antiquaquibacter soli TaxID=3064523 RepID=A0ABT9BLI0_9MICO|nr:heme-binding protein [Protaetiibacter sp. WY-16]MDO7881866.1 heme-binding protein [Protaetiibacter sp. WY-16]